MALSLHKTTSLVISLSLACLVPIVLAGCAGCGCSVELPQVGPTNGFSFSTDDVKCLSTTVFITKVGTTLPNGSTVTYTDQGTGKTYDGSGPTTANGIASGFPSGAPAGKYNVSVAPPGGTAELAGSLEYDAGSC